MIKSFKKSTGISTKESSTPGIKLFFFSGKVQSFFLKFDFLKLQKQRFSSVQILVKNIELYGCFEEMSNPPPSFLSAEEWLFSPNMVIVKANTSLHPYIATYVLMETDVEHIEVSKKQIWDFLSRLFPLQCLNPFFHFIRFVCNKYYIKNIFLFWLLPWYIKFEFMWSNILCKF